MYSSINVHWSLFRTLKSIIAYAPVPSIVCRAYPYTINTLAPRLMPSDPLASRYYYNFFLLNFHCVWSCSWVVSTAIRSFIRSFGRSCLSLSGVLVYHYTQRIQIHSVVFDDRGGQHTQPVTDRRNTASRKAICLLARWMSQGTVIERPLDPIWIWRMCEETDIASNKSIIAHD